MKSAFGPGRVLVVSNSAGTRKDTAGVAVSHCSCGAALPKRSRYPSADFDAIRPSRSVGTSECRSSSIRAKSPDAQSRLSTTSKGDSQLAGLRASRRLLQTYRSFQLRHRTCRRHCWVATPSPVCRMRRSTRDPLRTDSWSVPTQMQCRLDSNASLSGSWSSAIA